MDAALDQLVDDIERRSLTSAERLLHEHGVVPPPTVFLLSARQKPTYLGHVTARRYRAGTDAAAQAIADLGLLPSVLQGPRLVSTWENADLRQALGEAGATFPAALVVLDATLQEHTVRWHPFTPVYGSSTAGGMRVVTPEWGEQARLPGAALPPAVAALLALWREQRGGELGATRAELERSGYRVSWVADRLHSRPAPPAASSDQYRSASSSSRS